MGKGYEIYTVAVGSQYIPNVKCVRRAEGCTIFDSDEAARKQALDDGVALIVGMPGVPDFVYLDTPANRKAIVSNLRTYPDLWYYS